MPLYSYKARNSRGNPVTGELDATSPDAVAAQLINVGITPISINEAKKKGGVFHDLSRSLNAGKPNLDDLILFCRQMYTLIRAGVPLIRGITGLADTSKNIMLGEALTKMRVELESGRELSLSMSQHKIFPPMVISLVRVGENTGALDEAFLQLSRYLELERDTRNRISTAMRYPTFVIIALIAAVSVVNIFVVPAFSNVFSSLKQELPWQTQALITISDFTVAYWPFILSSFVVLVVGTRAYVQTSEGQYRWDRLKLKLPLIGSIVLRATLARFSRSFAISSKSGVPLIQALTVTSRAVDNEFIAEKVLSMRSGIERGDSLTRTAAATAMFTPLVLQMMAVGEETGAVDDMLNEVADYYEREVDYDLKSLSSAIEPILIVAVGILVLILALGIFLPMWDLTKIAS